jgi:bacterial/archaeal transporter family-2 protein
MAATRYDKRMTSLFAEIPVKELTYTLLLVAGALITIQASINARLGQLLGNNMHAVLVSFIVGTVAAILYCLIEGGRVASLDSLRGGPWWVWTGGLLGVVFVWTTIVAVPRVGVSVMFPIVVAGQMIAAIVVEHFGLLGAPRQPASLTRIGGVGLVVLGVVVLGMTRNTQPVE